MRCEMACLPKSSLAPYGILYCAMLCPSHTPYRHENIFSTKSILLFAIQQTPLWTGLPPQRQGYSFFLQRRHQHGACSKITSSKTPMAPGILWSDRPRWYSMAESHIPISITQWLSDRNERKVHSGCQTWTDHFLSSRRCPGKRN